MAKYETIASKAAEQTAFLGEYEPEDFSLDHSMESGARYYSLLDRLHHDQCLRLQRYEGTLAIVLDDLEEAARAPERWSNLVQLVFHPPRVIRALIDYKIANPDSPFALDLMQEAISLGLDIYRQAPNICEKVTQFRQQVARIEGSDLSTTKIIQPEDQITWNATDPKKSQETATKLALEDQKGNILFIALAHGGVAAGMDVFLRYCDLTDSDSAFYAVRFSCHKLGDEAPCLSPEETKYLQDLAVRRRVVLFDEDSFTGQTLRCAQKYFMKNVFPDQAIGTVVNHDARKKLQKRDPLMKQFKSEMNNLILSPKQFPLNDLHEKKIIGDCYKLPFEPLKNLIIEKSFFVFF